jgi:response regulator RpfG family c-di-GMP phosphodiesterase
MTGSILIVDDDAKVLEILGKSLSHRGHEVRTAAAGREALDSCTERVPDVIVLDLVLPDMDGRDVLKAIRTQPGGGSVPVLFLSANGDPDTRVNALTEGAEDYIVKPFSLRELNAKIEMALGRTEKTKSMEAKRIELEDLVEIQEKNALAANKELKKQILSMKTLFAVSQDLNRRLDSDELINGLALSLIGELQVASMAFFELDEDDGNGERLTLHDLKGFDKGKIDDLELPLANEFIQWAKETTRPRKIASKGDSQWSARLPDIRLAAFKYVTPIIVRQELIGLVFTGPKLNGKEYKPFELDLLASLCNSAGTAMEHARLFQQLESTYLSTVKALMSIVEAKDPYTSGHTERVAEYAVALGIKMRLGKKELRDLSFGAVLHDIGKLVVIENVLKKPGNLDNEEWEILKSHPVIGASIIENMEFLSGAVALVRHHHERFDGQGYPDGLKGDDIPLGARIITVADSFDAMTTDRPYRAALSRDVALGTMIAKAGTQFDARVVEKFVELVQDDGFEPRPARSPKPELSRKAES